MNASTDKQWSEWIEHDGGECPIPDARASEYQLMFGIAHQYQPIALHAIECDYPLGSGIWPKEITHYRVLKGAQ